MLLKMVFLKFYIYLQQILYKIYLCCIQKLDVIILMTYL